jgi:hypothetical protein
MPGAKSFATACSLPVRTETPEPGPTGVGLTEGPIAGAVDGLGASEVARRRLTDAEIRVLLRTEVDERLAAAELMAAHGRPEPAATARSEAAVIANVLGAL